MNIDITAELSRLPKHSRGRKVLEGIAKSAMTADLMIDWQCQDAVAKALADFETAIEFEPMLGDVAFLLDGGMELPR